MIDGEKFLKITRGTAGKQVFVLGEVVTANPLQIRLDGHDSQLNKQFKRLSSYSPSVGDRVIIAIVRNGHVVMGKIV